MEWLLILLVVIIIVTAIRTFSNSVATRRSQGEDRAKHQAQMNINMGVMFITLSVLQGITIGGSVISSVLIFLIGAVGLFNFIHGVRGWRALQKADRP